MLALSFLLLLGGLLHLFLFFFNRYLLCIPDGPWKRPIHLAWLGLTVPIPLMVVVACMGFPAVQEAMDWRPHSTPAKALFTCYVLLVGFWITRLLVWLLDRLVPEIPANLLAEEVTRPDLPAVPSTLPRLLRPFDTTGDLRLVRRELSIPGLAADFDGLVIAHVGDVHFGQRLEMENYLDAVRELVNGLAVDIVAFTGDFVDRRRDITAAIDYHAGFRASLGAVCVLGNHDYWTRGDRIARGLDGAGISWLGAGDRRVLRRGGRRLIFTGTDYPWDATRRDWRRAIRRETGDALIFLSHTPDNAPAAAREGASLILSGHNHGGQMCVPLLGPFIVPSRYGLRYSGGVYRVGGDCVLNVTRGVGVSEGGSRINCPPEVCVLTLRAPAVEAMAGRVIDARQLLKDPAEETAAGTILANRSRGGEGMR